MGTIRKTYVNKTGEELKQVALDLFKGIIFSDRHLINEPNMLTSVFMVLPMLDKEKLEELKNNDVHFIFEYLDKALPRSINGCPAFMSLQYLDKDDTEKMFKYYREIERKVKSV